MVIPTSPGSYTTARIRVDSEDPSDRRLALQTSQRSANGALAEPHQSWTCGPEGVPALQAFLAEQFPETGCYTLATTSDAALATIAQQIEDGHVDVAETLRTYNSYLARVEVITYQELLDGAERSFTLTGAEYECHPRDQLLAA